MQVKTGLPDFHQTYMSFLGNCQLSTISFKTERLTAGHSLLPWFMKECWAKNHDRREKQVFVLILILELRFEIGSAKLPHAQILAYSIEKQRNNEGFPLF